MMKKLYNDDDEPSSNEEADEVKPEVLLELLDNVVVTEPEAFIKTFMYRGESSTLQTDTTLANECFESLERQEKDPKFKKVVQSMKIEAGMPVKELQSLISPYAKGEFRILSDHTGPEKELYPKLVRLLTYINTFFRLNFKDTSGTKGWSPGIDKMWRKAQDPTSVEPEVDEHPKARFFLQRRFIITSKKSGAFSNHIVHPPQLLPDLCLVLGPAKPSKGSKKDPKNDPLYWKDVKVPIEVKLQDGFDAARLCQMARYARAVRLEQFDRNVIFSILFTKRKCHVFHWDAAGCHTMEIDIHKDPTTFIRVIGRFASMSPESLGYDLHFSNAGRVLGGEDCETVLEISSRKAQQFHDESPDDDQPEKVMKLYLSVKNPIFEAREYLFSRFTRVWEGREVLEGWTKGPVRVVKQNWADAERINEAYLCDQIRDVPNVAKVLGSQVVDSTAKRHNGITQDDVLGVYGRDKVSRQSWESDPGTKEKALPLRKLDGIPRLFERVLVRMVFEQRGRSVHRAKDCRELLQATRDWVEGLEGLRDRGVIHRDISTGNLLLGQDRESRAFIIDLGLAYLLNQAPQISSSTEIGEDREPRDHHHLTGTLPFIASEVLSATVFEETHVHKFQDDIESVFWVLLYVVLSGEKSKAAEISINGLLAPKAEDVLAHKVQILSKSLAKMKFSGRFKDMVLFLNEFAKACWSYSSEECSLEAVDIFDMIDRAFNSFPEEVEEAHALGPVPDVQFSNQSARSLKRKREDHANQSEDGMEGDEDVAADEAAQQDETEGGLGHSPIRTRSGKDHRRRP